MSILTVKFGRQFQFYSTLGFVIATSCITYMVSHRLIEGYQNNWLSRDYVVQSLFWLIGPTYVLFSFLIGFLFILKRYNKIN